MKWTLHSIQQSFQLEQPAIKASTACQCDRVEVETYMWAPVTRMTTTRKTLSGVSLSRTMLLPGAFGGGGGVACVATGAEADAVDVHEGPEGLVVYTRTGAFPAPPARIGEPSLLSVALGPPLMWSVALAPTAKLLSGQSGGRMGPQMICIAKQRSFACSLCH